jgi:hypothetical protein
MPKRHLAFLAIACALAVLAPVVSATTVARMDLRELVSTSPSIVYGSVISTQSRWNEDRTLIVTEVRVRVLDALKGEPAGEIIVRHPGGQVGKLLVEVPGASAFRPGEEAVLFLAPGPSGVLWVNGMNQGRYDVTENPRTGEKTVRGLDLEKVQALGVAVAAQGAAAPGGPVPLNRFLGGLRELVQDVAAKGGK